MTIQHDQQYSTINNLQRLIILRLQNNVVSNIEVKNHLMKS